MLLLILYQEWEGTLFHKRKSGENLPLWSRIMPVETYSGYVHNIVVSLLIKSFIFIKKTLNFLSVLFDFVLIYYIKHLYNIYYFRYLIFNCSFMDFKSSLDDPYAWLTQLFPA